MAKQEYISKWTILKRSQLLMGVSFQPLFLFLFLAFGIYSHNSTGDFFALGTWLILVAWFLSILIPCVIVLVFPMKETSGVVRVVEQRHKNVFALHLQDGRQFLFQGLSWVLEENPLISLEMGSPITFYYLRDSFVVKIVSYTKK